LNVIRQLKTELNTGDKLDDGIEAAIAWLGQHQEPEGFWVGKLESNSCIEAQWILAMHLMGVKNDFKYTAVVQAILNEQREDGSWEVYHDAPAGDINATVECYAALRTAGYDSEDPRLRKARNWIFAQGGLQGVRMFTRYWLALIGEWPWEATPDLAPEIIFLPAWCPLNIYSFSSWARATLVPLCVLSARRPVRPLPAGRCLDELFPEGRESMDYSMPRHGKGWVESVFLIVDWLLKKYQKWATPFGREWAVRLCREWVIQHQDADGGWGGIQPPLIYSLVALHSEGYGLDHPVVAKGLDSFNAPCAYEKDGGIYLQCSESPIWDTLFSILAYFECGHDLESAPQLQSALRWILDKQITAGGDWQIKVHNVRSGGWAFERANTFYPDVDDTALAILLLTKARTYSDDPAEIDQALELAEEWVRGMQCSNGGWAAFDRDNNSVIVTKIPFCDFGEVLDPPSADVTAHVVEALAALGRDLEDPAVASALAYIKSEQEPAGSWFGRWGVNHIYGTAAVLPALVAIGEDMTAAYVLRAAEWLVRHQNADGGWGESCGSYMEDSLRGRGDSTASQTAWALMALLSLGGHGYDQVIRRGLDYLLETQVSGSWEEAHYTGTGFPGYGIGERTNLKKTAASLGQGSELARGFMINYNMYRHYFPLIALGRARQHFGDRVPLEMLWGESQVEAGASVAAVSGRGAIR
jgi:squalene-hopene/tetraprenyl-beta-curcumene cyclase